MLKPRWLVRFINLVRNYPWLPCPICGKDFAGFEAGEYSFPINKERSLTTCNKPTCQKRAKEATEKLWGIKFD